MSDTFAPLKLPFWRTVIDAHVVAFVNVRKFLSFAWPWAILLVTAAAALNWAMWPLEQAATESGQLFGSLWYFFLPLAASTLIGALVAVPWHRFVLMREAQTAASPLKQTAAAMKYFGVACLMFSPLLLPMAAIQIAAPSLGLPAQSEIASQPSEADAAQSSKELANFAASSVAFLLGPCAALLYVPTRLYLLLPAIALHERQHSLRQLWNKTRGNFWRLYLGSGLVFALPFVAIVLQTTLQNDDLTRATNTLSQVTAELILFTGGIIGVTFLSLAYQHFFPHGPDTKIAE